MPNQNKKRIKLWSILSGSLLILLFSIAYQWGKKTERNSNSNPSHPSVQALEKTKGKKEIYNCPMHPSVVSDHPDICPICHMNLQKVDSDENDHDQSQMGQQIGNAKRSESKIKEKKILFYRNPMRADITSPAPAKDEMGMDYIPVYSDEVEESANGSSSSAIEGRASFRLSTERQQLIGVTTTKADIRELGFEIRASGKVAFDPELFSAVEEYRQALLSRNEMEGSPYKSLKSQASELVRSARTKLKLMGLGDHQISKLATGSSGEMNLLLPTGKVWVYAEVFEYEVAGVKSGQSVEVNAPSVPGKVFAGKVASVSPILNSQTRTVRVRSEVPDPMGDLRPDSFVNVRIKIELGKRLAVPVDSILHSGDQDFVFLVEGDGHFEPRRVQVGFKAQEFYEIVSGIETGDKVVTAANFLIDSESKLRNALKNLTGSPGSHTPRLKEKSEMQPKNQLQYTPNVPSNQTGGSQ